MWNRYYELLWCVMMKWCITMYHVLIRTLSSNLVCLILHQLKNVVWTQMAMAWIASAGHQGPRRPCAKASRGERQRPRDPETPRPQDQGDHMWPHSVAMIHETHGVTYLCTRSSTYARKVQENNKKDDHIKYTVIYLIALISHWIHIHI